MNIIDIVGEYPKLFAPPVLLCMDDAIAISTTL